MLLESSITLQENIYSTGITYDDHHLQLLYFYNAGPDDTHNNWHLAIFSQRGMSHLKNLRKDNGTELYLRGYLKILSENVG